MTKKPLSILAILLSTLFISPQAKAANEAEKLFEKGTFFSGVNFWGSESAIYMWRNWNPESVELDLKTLSENGVEVIRCFPLWPDFQPLTKVIGIRGRFREYGMKGGPMTDPDGVDQEMMERFRKFADLAYKYNIRLIPGIITGWMSGRLFVPDALQDLNVITSAEALKWEVRFVRRFVREFKDHPAIAAWDLGNECNCMGEAANMGEGWMWLNTISSAIRLEDSSRPVVSGMHGIKTESNEVWNLRDQGELLDVLTPHPYPGFRPEANREPMNCLRNANHPSAQCLMYEGVAGKPAISEETGSMGPNMTTDETSAKVMKMQMFQSWADGLTCYMWWCAYDQMHHNYPPYTWNMMERELGITTKEHQPRAPLLAMKEFKAFRDSLPFKKLPARQIDAVAFLTENQEAWPMPIGALCLARQAGIDIKFAGAEQTIPDAAFYILPSPQGWNTYSKIFWDALKEKVRSGATLLISRGFDQTGFSEFEEVAGVRIEAQYRGGRTPVFSFNDSPKKKMKGIDNAVSIWKATRAEVLAKDEKGNPMVTRADYGKGQVICVNFALEQMVVDKLDGVFTWKVENPLYRIYQKAAVLAGVQRKVTRDNPNLTMTEHPAGDGRTLVVAINCLPEDISCPIRVNGKVGCVWGASYAKGKLNVKANDGCIFEVLSQEKN